MVSHLSISDSHSQCRRDAVRGMSADEGVIFALSRCREGMQTPKFTISIEDVASASKNLMSISLMPHVPDYSVFRGIIDIMQSNSQFYCSQ